MEFTKEHKSYLSSKLTGTAPEDVLTTAVLVAQDWGFAPDTEEPTDEEWSRAENATMEIADAIVEGLADGSVKVRGNVKVKSVEDPEADAILDQLIGA